MQQPEAQKKAPARFTLSRFLIVLVLLLAIAPFFLRRGAEFAGSDDGAKDVIAEFHPGYKPWAHALWTPPSSEIESLLFALQAAAGAGFIGYYLGLKRGRKEAAMGSSTEGKC